jgi:hypothetical protein
MKSQLQSSVLRRNRTHVSRSALETTWINAPAAIAGITAVVGGVISLGLAVYNSSEQRKLEERKFEEGRIIELLRTASIEKARENLEFLVKSGLVQDARLAASVDAYLKSTPKNQGPYLPKPTSTLGYEFRWGTSHFYNDLDGGPAVISCVEDEKKCTLVKVPNAAMPGEKK